MPRKKKDAPEEKPCLVCKRIEQIKKGTNRYFLAELDTGYVVLEDYQQYAGYVLFLCKECKTELHQLEKSFRLRFLEEMSQVEEAVYLAEKPRKMNLELLGNKCPHLHWHIIPRRSDDTKPIWCTPEKIRHSEAWWLFDDEIGATKELKDKIIGALAQIRKI